MASEDDDDDAYNLPPRCGSELWAGKLGQRTPVQPVNSKTDAVGNEEPCQLGKCLEGGEQHDRKGGPAFDLPLN